MTGDLQERMKLNSYRFVAVQVAQFIVGMFTLPLVKKIADAAGGGRGGLQHGWHTVVMIWAVLCLVLFMVTFLTTRERIKPINDVKSPPLADFRDLLRNRPWLALVVFTLFNFAMLTYRGAATYNFYHHYADKPAMFDILSGLGLTASQAASQGGPLEFLGYIVHGARETAASSNVADVFNSIINGLGTATTIVVIILSNGLSRRLGKKTVIACGFSLSALNAFWLYLLPPTAVYGMLAQTVLGSIVYAPTIPVAWAMYADAADFSEWQTGRRFTGIVFATIGFALKAGLGLGSAVFLYLMALLWHYDTSMPSAPNAIAGYHASLSIMVGLLFVCGMIAMLACPLNKAVTLKMAGDLAGRRAQPAG
jgi:Na+/melibiose symporter-like transporter